MAEENKKEEVKEIVKEDKHEPSEVETKALAMGWKSEDQLPSGVEFIPADEFVRRKPLFDKIESQKRFYDEKIRGVEQTLNQLTQHHAKVKETEYQRALKELRFQKRTAMKEGDTVVALELEDKMDELTETHQESVKEAVQEIKQSTSPTPEFLFWVKSNDWYMKDSDMHDFADGVAASFVQRSRLSGQSIDEQEVFSHVLDKVRRAYPEKFENPNRNLPGKVNSGNVSGKTKKSDFKLTDEQEEVARNFAKNGVMTKEQYVKELEGMHERGEL